jgi:hypothetical protein
VVILSRISENQLRIISKIIIEKTYPKSRNYGGWFNAFPIKFNKKNNEFFQFNFKDEKDIIALIFLATVWNMQNYKWENAVGLIGVLHNRNLLSINEWSSRSFINNLNKNELENEMNDLDNMNDDLDLSKRGRLYIKSGKDGVFERLHKISCEYDYLKTILKIDEILKGNRPQIDSTIFHEMDNERLKYDANGRNNIKIKKPLLRVKVPLILRELKCSDAIVVDDKYCCVPDSRVRKIMSIIGYPQEMGVDSNSVIRNSEIISKYFGNYYDLPLFDFLDYCKQENCKGNECEIFNHCAKNKSEKSDTVQLGIEKDFLA